MKSFTANSRLGTVRVRLPDDQEPHVIIQGQIVAHGVPISIEGPALSFPSDDEPLVVVPAGAREERKVRSVTATEGDTREDLTALASIGFLAIDGLPVAWGPRVDERRKRLSAFTFEDGEQQTVMWAVDLEPIRKKCCGRR